MKKKPDRPKYFIKEETERPATKREVMKFQKEKEVGDCILKKSIIENKSFTSTEINKLVKEKILTEIKFRGKIYFRKDDVSIAMKYLIKQAKLQDKLF